ncbi:hypothetical protein K5V21_01275 [Clostridium sardiniense]|uniref:Uncharacterized protein n=1 Tax=Clostridium sardiniense TaxID=29369 RepID=A0ABS7KTE2_CLOSR|nr:hypothetical protein [Clostridium sardiniense]MBY0754076.1 hypothetical protein [Clostridium sardiniense]MDQ0459402.1 hypothetical protein [Clostridium sardiniense]
MIFKIILIIVSIIALIMCIRDYRKKKLSKTEVILTIIFIMVSLFNLR